MSDPLMLPFDLPDFVQACECDGSGVCPDCGGEGAYTDPADDLTRLCETCNGWGFCPFCDDEGGES